MIHFVTPISNQCNSDRFFSDTPPQLRLKKWQILLHGIVFEMQHN